jgi:hypothetical protein
VIGLQRRDTRFQVDPLAPQPPRHTRARPHNHVSTPVAAMRSLGLTLAFELVEQATAMFVAIPVRPTGRGIGIVDHDVTLATQKLRSYGHPPSTLEQPVPSPGWAALVFRFTSRSRPASMLICTTARNNRVAYITPHDICYIGARVCYIS